MALDILTVGEPKTGTTVRLQDDAYVLESDSFSEAWLTKEDAEAIVAVLNWALSPGSKEAK